MTVAVHHVLYIYYYSDQRKSSIIACSIIYWHATAHEQSSSTTWRPSGSSGRRTGRRREQQAQRRVGGRARVRGPLPLREYLRATQTVAARATGDARTGTSTADCPQNGLPETSRSGARTSTAPALVRTGVPSRPSAGLLSERGFDPRPAFDQRASVFASSYVPNLLAIQYFQL